MTVMSIFARNAKKEKRISERVYNKSTMKLFNSQYESSMDAFDTDKEFKLFAEAKMESEGDRFFGYSDAVILKVLREEFSMFKNAAPNKEGEAEAKKSKIPSFKSIGQALKASDYGQIFTTPQSDRIYVITRGTWGEKSSDKVVKGFPLSTDMAKIKKYSKRTKVKHGGSSPESLNKDEITPSILRKRSIKPSEK
jgi:hypothetical protein